MSVAWVTIDEPEDLRRHFIDDQWKLILDWQQDPEKAGFFSDAVREASSEIRTAIASNPRNTLSQTATSVPPECLGMLGALVVAELQAQFSASTPLTPQQLEDVKRAQVKLEQIRDWSKPGNQFIISKPTDPETEPSQVYEPPATDVGCSRRLATRKTLRAL